MQWIDFRKGVRNLDAIAKLLPQPEKMLKAIGVRPTSSGQAAMPNVVLALVDFLIIIGMVEIGSFFAYMLELNNLNIRLIFEYESLRASQFIFAQFLCMVITGWLLYFMIRSLTERSGVFASPFVLPFGLGAVFFFFAFQASLGIDLSELLLNYGVVAETMFSILPFMILMVGGLFVAVMVLFQVRTLLHWFPARTK